jgi:hypothetical protein
VVAHELDEPPGQMTAFVLSVILLAAWIVRALGGGGHRA